MTLAVPPEQLEAFLTLSARREVEATVLGAFTDTGLFHVRYDGETVALLDMAFLHDGLPDMRLPARWRPPRIAEPTFACPADLTPALLQLLGPPQHLQQGMGHPPVRPRGAGHQRRQAARRRAERRGPATLLSCDRCRTPWKGSSWPTASARATATSTPMHMVANAIDEAIRNVIAVGGRLGHVAGLDNFCWPDPVLSPGTPDGPYKLAQLVRANQALYDCCTAYGVPCISGKDSMKNDYHVGDVKISVPPTLLFSVIARMPDVRQAVTMDAKQAGDLVFVGRGNAGRTGRVGVLCHAWRRRQSRAAG